ncbi:unnamed protein product [Paramecium octaurelia]|uniref:Uncharacterized protein n=1 Tax=Paramecium octaurelia TaxID=43137 RepID=A0A8S1SZE1_PAROT|nr:unnamed protein product [Paramecium octaurelia]
MENPQNSPIARYQLFVKRSLTRQVNNQKALPVFGCKINIQSPRLQHNQICLQLSPNDNQSAQSHSINHELSTVRNLPKKDSSYQYYINQIRRRKSLKKFNFENSETNTNLFKKQQKPYQTKYNIVLPQLYTPMKIKKQFLPKNIFTEPSLQEELQPWESSHKSIPYF